jgi:hypothetical protein
MSEVTPANPFPQTTTPAIERANRLISLKNHPGMMDLLQLSQEMVDYAQAASTDYPGWDTQQMVVLKVRAQAAKEHHQALINKLLGAIQDGVNEQRALSAALPTKTAEEVLEHGDYTRQEVLKKFDEYDSRIPGSY